MSDHNMLCYFNQSAVQIIKVMHKMTELETIHIPLRYFFSYIEGFLEIVRFSLFSIHAHISEIFKKYVFVILNIKICFQYD